MYKISEIAEMVGGRLVGDPDVCVRRLLMDSRLLFFPEETMFVAIKSVRDDGHNYIEDLYHRNVRCFMVSQELLDFKQFAGACFVVVKDTVAALQRLTAAHRSRFNVGEESP